MEYQEVEITIKGKVKMPTAPVLIEQYGNSDVLEAVIEDWTFNPDIILENVEDWFLVTVSKVNPIGEPSLIEHVKKTL